MDRTCIEKRSDRIKQTDAGDGITRKKKKRKTRWKDNVIRDMWSIGVEQEEALNRAVWKRLVHHHCGDSKG